MTLSLSRESFREVPWTGKIKKKRCEQNNYNQLKKYWNSIQQLKFPINLIFEVRMGLHLLQRVTTGTLEAWPTNITFQYVDD